MRLLLTLALVTACFALDQGDCLFGQLQCEDGQCIDENDFCDGHVDMTTEVPFFDMTTEAPFFDITTAAPFNGLEACEDTADGATGSNGDGCDFYDQNPSDCGNYDTSDFVAGTMCCACGDGDGDGDAANDQTYDGWEHHASVGWCDSDLDEDGCGDASTCTLSDCIEGCIDLYPETTNVEYTCDDGSGDCKCYCQNSCPCMKDAGDSSTWAPTGSLVVPEPCVGDGDDDDDDIYEYEADGDGDGDGEGDGTTTCCGVGTELQGDECVPVYHKCMECEANASYECKQIKPCPAGDRARRALQETAGGCAAKCVQDSASDLWFSKWDHNSGVCVATVEGCVSVCKTARGDFAWTCDYSPCEASDGTSRRLTAARC